MAQTIGSLDLNAFSDLYSDSTQYFWFESNASATYGAGAHVTLVPDTSFISNPTGQNILMNTDGFSIRNGLLPMMTLDNNSLDFNVVNTTAGTYVKTATFGSTGATIGQTTGTHIQISSYGLDVNTDSLTNIANFGTNGARIGQSSGSHSVIDANGQRFYATNGTTQLANIGYGEGVDVTSNISVAPYYTFGTRGSDTPSTRGNYSVAEGDGTVASGFCAHAEGSATTASGNFSHAEGGGHMAADPPVASGYCSHAEGVGTIASNIASHAEGWTSEASGEYSHAEGFDTKAQVYAHAEGYETTASGVVSHAEGEATAALGAWSHTQNYHTVATEDAQTVIGKYNAATVTGSGSTSNPYVYTDVGDYAFIIGNGTDNTTAARSNAFTVDWKGNVEAARDYYSKVNRISLGTYITGGVLTGGGSYIHFSIPTGRVFPDGTTISKITFNIVVRAGNHNASGLYIVKNASGGTDVKYYDSTASFQFYNGANQSKTLTTAMSDITLQGGTNIYVSWHGSGDYFFSGTSTYNGYVNNQPISIMLTEITATLNIPS